MIILYIDFYRHWLNIFAVRIDRLGPTCFDHHPFSMSTISLVSAATANHLIERRYGYESGKTAACQQH